MSWRIGYLSSLAVVAISCATSGCSSGSSPVGSNPIPSPTVNPSGRVEIMSGDRLLEVLPVNHIGCSGALVGVPIRTSVNPNLPVSGMVDARVSWSPAPPNGRVDIYLLHDLNIPCTFQEPVCSGVLAQDYSANQHPKEISYNTVRSTDPTRALLYMCNRSPIPVIASWAVGFTPDK